MAAAESLITLKRATRAVPEAAAEPRQDDLQSTYRKAAAEYRRDDEIEVRTDHHCGSGKRWLIFPVHLSARSRAGCRLWNGPALSLP
jgi:hypothetical protein